MNINKLQFRDKNPRKISDENLEKLKKSIKDDETFLTKRKILINHIDWKYIVYCWNQRVRALKELWYKEIPDEWIDIDENLSKELMEKRAFKDNVEYWEWDYDILKDFDMDFLKDLDLPDVEIDLSQIEMSQYDLDEENEDNAPEPQKEAKLVELGDIFWLWAYIEKDWKRLNIIEFIK